MLKLSSRRAAKYTCPNHPRQKYDIDHERSNCSTCEAIWRVNDARIALDLAERRAEQWAARARMAKGGAV